MEENKSKEIDTDAETPKGETRPTDPSVQAGAHYLAALLDIQDKEKKEELHDLQPQDQAARTGAKDQKRERPDMRAVGDEEAYSFRLSMAAAPFGPGSFIATVTSPSSVHLTNDRWDVVFSKPSASEVIRHFRGLASPGSWIPVAKSDKTEETAND